MSPEHHALALTGSRLGELAPTLTIEFQDNAVRRFTGRPQMDDLTYTLRQLCQRNRDGSYNTQADRIRSLALAARQLREAGFRQMKASSLKGKHAQVPAQLCGSG